MQKLCKNPRCNTPFESEYPQKEYCSVRCRRTAKEVRAVTRDNRKPTTTQAVNANELNNPTMQQLAALSLVYAADANPTPTILTGVLPEGWKPPPGVMLQLQYKMDASEPDSWLLQTQVVDLMQQILDEEKKQNVSA